MGRRALDVPSLYKAADFELGVGAPSAGLCVEHIRANEFSEPIILGVLFADNVG